MDELITTLLTAEPPIPAIVNLASPEASLEKKTLELIEQSKKGLLLSWVPQKMILSHPATSFFVVRQSFPRENNLIDRPIDSLRLRKRFRSHHRQSAASYDPDLCRSTLHCRAE